MSTTLTITVLLIGAELDHPDPLEITHQTPPPIQTRTPAPPQKWFASQWRGPGADPGQIVEWTPREE